MNPKASAYWKKKLSEIEDTKKTSEQRDSTEPPSQEQIIQKYAASNDSTISHEIKTSEEDDIEFRDQNKTTAGTDATEFPTNRMDIYSSKLGKLGSAG